MSKNCSKDKHENLVTEPEITGSQYLEESDILKCKI